MEGVSDPIRVFPPVNVAQPLPYTSVTVTTFSSGRSDI